MHPERKTVVAHPSSKIMSQRNFAASRLTETVRDYDVVECVQGERETFFRASVVGKGRVERIDTYKVGSNYVDLPT